MPTKPRAPRSRCSTRTIVPRRRYLTSATRRRKSAVAAPWSSKRASDLAAGLVDTDNYTRAREVAKRALARRRRSR